MKKVTSLDYQDDLYQKEDLVSFYDMANTAHISDQVIIRLAQEAKCILDVGCGTGRLALLLRQVYPDKAIVAADVAHAMLQAAKVKPNAHTITWLLSSADQIDCDGQFDFIVLSGHVFQVFLSQEERIAVLKNLAKKLSPTGILLFDSRNPLDQDWLTWTPAQSHEILHHPLHAKVAVWNDYAWQGDVLHYQTFYQILANQQKFQASSAITFANWQKIKTALGKAGLKVHAVWGDWQQQVFVEETSPEIVVMAGLA